MIKFFIPGVPVPKGRPRFSSWGNRVTTHTPKKTVEWETHVEWTAKEYRPKEILEGPLTINLVFRMPRPKSLPKKVIHHIKKPDVDNLIKSVIDGLSNAKLFHNDSQFIQITATKIYHSDPGVEIIIHSNDISKFFSF